MAAHRDDTSRMFSDSPPLLPIHALPENEREHASFVGQNLNDLSSLCGDLEAAIALFQLNQSGANPADQGIGRLKFRWLFMAAREAASATYRFSEAIQALGKNLNKCPTLLGMVDPVAKRAAAKKFDEHFPGVAGVRHSGQHASRLYGTPEDKAKHAIGRGISVNNIHNNTVRTTFEKRVVELELTAGTLAKLSEVRNLYWAIFQPLDPIRNRGFPIPRKGEPPPGTD